ncbi:hypothetical protein C9I50_15050 [Pseudomonas prosekii]|uniref:hypothetical protein n=1 Tax=Pseudomonas TaxID=286 RepID=UPI000C328B03|nr:MULTISPECIES: hypothetical protein [Pseudomonas]PKH31355.1 hypothetical protein BI292_09250 [Pseudomonas sp. 43NM1]PWE40687.1 hypothetical protein C9I50_15050 [Pseudomonas prosekii]
MAVLDYEDLSHDEKTAQTTTGELSAFKDGTMIFQTNTVHYFRMSDAAFLIGDKDNQHVALSFPAKLQNGGPYIVNYKKDVVTLPSYLRWAVQVGGQHHFVEDGELSVTLNNYKQALGTYRVTLENDGGTVIGSFNMTND